MQKRHVNDKNSIDIGAGLDVDGQEFDVEYVSDELDSGAEGVSESNGGCSSRVIMYRAEEMLNIFSGVLEWSFLHSSNLRRLC